MSTTRAPGRSGIIVGVAGTLGVTFAMLMLANGEAFFSLLLLSVVVGVLLLVGETAPRSGKTVLGAGLVTFASVAAWWPLVQYLVER